MNIFEKLLGYLSWGVTEKYKRFFKLKTNIIAYLGFINFPIGLIVVHHYVIAGGALRSLDMGISIRDLDLFIRRKYFNEVLVTNILNNAGFKRYVGKGVDLENNIMRFTKNEYTLDIKIIEDNYKKPVYKLMDLTNCMISFGENGNLDISVDKQYIESLENNRISYNTEAIPYYTATLNRLKKFEDAGWDTSGVRKYIYDKERKDIEDSREKYGWEGS